MVDTGLGHRFDGLAGALAEVEEMNHLTLFPCFGLACQRSRRRSSAGLRHCADRRYMSVAALTATKPFGHAFGAYCFV